MPSPDKSPLGNNLAGDIIPLDTLDPRVNKGEYDWRIGILKSSEDESKLAPRDLVKPSGSQEDTPKRLVVDFVKNASAGAYLFGSGGEG